MGLTRFSGLSIISGSGGGGTLSITGPLTISGTVVHTGGYDVRQVARLKHTGSAIFTGGNNYRFTGTLRSTGTTIVTGGKTVRHTARLWHNGSAIFTGGNTNRMVGRLQVTGSLVLTGGASCKIKLRSNGTGAICGVRTINTGGSAVITTTKLTNNSVLMLTPLVNTGIAGVIAYEKYSVRSGAAGTFKVMLDHPGEGTAPTGRVGWMIVN